jgi:hypothetical protein
MAACRKVALLAARNPAAAAFLHGGEATHIEAGTKRRALAG